MQNKDIRYENALNNFVSVNSQILFTYDMLAEGKLSEAESVEILSWVKSQLPTAKAELISAKEDCGFNDGLKFMEDRVFAGFSLKDGRLLGDYKKAMKLALKWINRYPEECSNSLFELGKYILSLHPSWNGGDYV